jgi:hypothetical protein
MAKTPTDQAFLSLLQRPQGLSIGELATLVADLIEHDVYTVRQRLTKEPPVIAAVIPEMQAIDTAAALSAADIPAMAITQRQMLGMGQPMLVRFMTRTDSGYVVDIWHGPTTTIPFEGMQVLIRASLSPTDQQLKRIGAARGSNLSGDPGIGRSVGTIATRMSPMGRMGGLAGGMGQPAPEPAKPSAPNKAEVIDIHTNGLWFRINGDRFAWQVLGEERQYSDRANADLLFAWLKHDAPRAVPDSFFKLFKPPAGVRTGTALGAEQTGPFDFYSRWVCLIYRHMLGMG